MEAAFSLTKDTKAAGKPPYVHLYCFFSFTFLIPYIFLRKNDSTLG